MSDRTTKLDESVIREMTRLSDEYGAINLAQGMPDFDPPPQLVEAAVEAIRHGSNQYAVTWGQKSLREAIADRISEYNHIDANPETDITVTCGSTEAIAAAILALANPGDRIVVADPLYENYVPDAMIAGAEPIYVPFTPSVGFEEESLKTAMSKRPEFLLLNTPNNPTGTVLDRAQLRLIADLCEDSGTVVITDETYEHIIYDGKRHLSIGALGNMRERTVTVNAASKTYSVTGWRVGWAVAEKRLSAAVRKIHDYLTICAPTPFQEAVAIALRFPESYYTKLAEMYDKKRRQIMKALGEVGLEYVRPEGAYYMLVTAPPDFKDGQAFSDHLLKKLGIAVLPADALYHDKQFGKRKVRLAFCKKDTTLQETARRLKKLTPKAKTLQRSR